MLEVSGSPIRKFPTKYFPYYSFFACEVSYLHAPLGKYFRKVSIWGKSALPFMI